MGEACYATSAILLTNSHISIYQEIGPGERVALSKLAVEKFEETDRPLRIAIDVSIWLFQIQAGKGGVNPAPRTFYYRLLRLISLSIHPVFVFDGPNKPPFKRGKKTGGNVSSVPDFLAKQLIKQFGFPIHYAPGEAEAECALLQREGIVDAVLSEDVDTLMFGSGLTIRNWSPDKSGGGKTPTHVNVYDAVKTKNGPSGLDREGMILVALMSGGDYVPKGIEGCGPKTACEAARAGFGRDLCRIKRNDTAAVQAWRERLQHELITNESKFFKTKHKSIKIPDDFPRLDILGYYTHPVVSSQANLDNLRRSMSWDQDIDFVGLRSFTHDAFEWIRLEGAKHFIRNLAPALLIRDLRLRAREGRFTSDDPEAIKEDELLLIKGIHGKRQHPVTDNSTELRVSYTPIELVRIDLSKEEPDEAPEARDIGMVGLDGAADADLDILDDDEDDEPGVRKRGPTKFDPTKPARAWVMETYVRVGVPLTVQDYESGLRLGRRPAPAKATSKAAPKPKATRKTKAASDKAQPSIDQFARVTKPGVRARASSKDPKPSQPPPPASQPVRTARQKVVEIFSSSPPQPRAQPQAQKPREEAAISPTLESIPEIPSSVTRRRKRRPLARSHTSPAVLDSPARLPTPEPIQTLDLVSSPVAPSPSQFAAKKARTGTARNPVPSRITRQKSVTASPSKSKQTTLDAWSGSSPACTPTKSKTTRPAPSAAPPARPQFQTSIDTLDLTLSSPIRPPITSTCPPPITETTTSATTARSNSRRSRASSTEPRPPLQSISSNTSITSAISSTSTSSKPSTDKRASKPTGPTTRVYRRSPRLSRSISASAAASFSAEVDTLDLTALSSPAPPVAKSRALPQSQVQPQLQPPSEKSTTRLSTSEFGDDSIFDIDFGVNLAQPCSPPPQTTAEGSPCPRRSPRISSLHSRTSKSANVPASNAGVIAKSMPMPRALEKSKPREIYLLDSVPGTFFHRDVAEEGKEKVPGLKGRDKASRVWREDEVQVVDLTAD